MSDYRPNPPAVIPTNVSSLRIVPNDLPPDDPIVAQLELELMAGNVRPLVTIALRCSRHAAPGSVHADLSLAGFGWE